MCCAVLSVPMLRLSAGTAADPRTVFARRPRDCRLYIIRFRATGQESHAGVCVCARARMCACACVEVNWCQVCGLIAWAAFFFFFFFF